MVDGSHCPQIGDDDWEHFMNRVVEIYAEEVLSREQVETMSKRILANVYAKIESGELVERKFTVATGSACEDIFIQDDCI